MTNCSLIEEAVKLIIDHCEVNGITMETLTTYERVKSWYNHSDIADAEVLAAAALTDYYDCKYDYDTILRWKEHYFPETPVEYQGHIHVSELLEV